MGRKNILKILIVGATSSLGQALKPVLSEFAEVYTAARKNCDIKLDLTAIDASMRLPKNLDVVINTAAHFGGRNFEDYANAVNTNVMGTLSLLNLCRQNQVGMFVQISSVFTLLEQGAEYYNSYSITKKHADEIARKFCEENSMPLAVIRLSQMYGDNDSFRKHQNLFYAMADKAEKGEDILIYGSHDAKRNYIHVDDITAVIASVIKNKIYGVYTCAYPQDTTLSQVAKAAHDAFSKGGQVRFLTDKPNLQDVIFPNDFSLYEKINYFPKISVEEGFRRIANAKI
jgi:nucleoside-diphosphate-sugar epimerase